MAISKFTLVESKKDFFYDNKMNTLTDANGTPLSPNEGIADVPGSITKSSSLNTLKIIMGHACNYDCSYCLQKDIGDPSERIKNKNTPSLIRSIEKYLTINEGANIQLWGGEPFLYWNDIVPIVSAFDREDINWTIITNGSTLKHKHVEFFDGLRGTVGIGISHDGPAHTTLRGPEFLHKKVGVIRNLQQSDNITFSFNPVISKSNINPIATNDFFVHYLESNDLDKVSLSFELGRAYGLPAPDVIQGFNLSVYQNNLRLYLNAHIDEMIAGNPTMLSSNLFNTGPGVVAIARSLRSRTPYIYNANCGMDNPNTMSIDMLGNIRSCQNTDDSYIGGNISDVTSAALPKTDFSREGFCGPCPVKHLCRNSCPLDLGETVFKINHEIEYVHYMELLLAAFRLMFREQVEFKGIV